METTVESADDWLEECLETATKRCLDETSGKHAPGGKGGWLPTGSNDTGRSKPGGDSTNQVVIKRPKGEHKENRLASKPHSTPLTLKWLEENYEFAEGVCIPRSALYVHYLDFCEKNDSQPVNAASFGKIIRQQFPQITTRRLGTRGQSKYHYYGIGVRETSKYYELMYSRKGVQSSGDGKKDSVKQIVAYSPRSKLGTLLPEFPSVQDMVLPPDVSVDKVSTFVMMYRTHCQRILDTVIRANFDEVQSFLLHFWQGMPPHIVPILETRAVVRLVGVCDCILYKAISGVLMPTVLQALPESLTQVIRKFAKQFDDWLKLALDELPELLRKMKFDLSRRFGQLLRRQVSLNHLCQASRSVVHSSDILCQMVEDWQHVDLGSICKQTLYTMDTYSDKEHEMIVSLYREFETLLEEQAPMECYTEWLDSMIHRCVVQPSAKKPGVLRRRARQFLLMWSCFGTRVIRDMTLHSAPSFGSFHLLHLMFDDYVLYQVEQLHSQERASELLRKVKGEEADDDMSDDLVLPQMTSPFQNSSVSTSACQVAERQTDRQTVITDAREAYPLVAASYSPGSSGSASSPTPSAMSAGYDGRMEGQMTPLSPGHRQDSIQGDGYHYGRYMHSMTSHPLTSHPNGHSDVSGNYAYAFTSPNSQYYYGRDGSGSEWSEQSRYNQSTSGSNVINPGSSSYVVYGQGRTAEYDQSTYHYDNNVYNTGTRTNLHSGLLYQHYDTSYYGNTNPHELDALGRKRKSEADDIRVSSHKRMASDYSYMVPGNYARA